MNDRPQNLPIEKIANRILGAGPSFPFKFSTSGSVHSVSLSEGPAKVNQSIHVILSTGVGERVNRPTFGCFGGDSVVWVSGGKTSTIKSMVGTGELDVFGVDVVPPTGHHSGGPRLVQVKSDGVVSRGEMDTMVISVKDAGSVVCTPDHLFLLNNFKTWRRADELSVGSRLAWVPMANREIRLRTRMATSKTYMRPLMSLPHKASERGIEVSEIKDGKRQEVYDVTNTTTQNWILGGGLVVHNSNLQKLIWEPNDDLLFPRLRWETAEALRLWEKRIIVDKVDILSPSSIASVTGLLESTVADIRTVREALRRDDNMIGIFIQYRLVKTNTRGSYIYPFTRESVPVTFGLDHLFERVT